jgi:hypothetical protein
MWASSHEPPEGFLKGAEVRDALRGEDRDLAIEICGADL